MSEWARDLIEFCAWGAGAGALAIAIVLAVLWLAGRD